MPKSSRPDALTHYRRFLGGLILLVAVGTAPLGAQSRYGFVSRLGHDTVFVERVVRTPNHLSGDVLELNPIVMIRHFDAALAGDGSVTRFRMDSWPVNPGAAPSEHEELEFEGDTLQVTSGAGEDIAWSAVATRGALIMPWFRSSYATSEQLLIAAARRRGDTMTVTTYTPSGVLRGFGSTLVRQFAGDSASLDYRAMPIVGRYDFAGRIVSFSGDRTTNKLDVTRVETAPAIEVLAAGFAKLEREAGGKGMALSPHQTVRATIGDATLVIEYGSPRLRGRRAIGRLVPMDSVWRTGADEATELEVSAGVTVAGIDLKPGRYTLWTMLTEHGAWLIVNRQTGQWGTDYDPAQDLARAPLTVALLDSPVEALSIRIEKTGPTAGALVIEWDSFRWTATIVSQR